MSVPHCLKKKISWQKISNYVVKPGTEKRKETQNIHCYGNVDLATGTALRRAGSVHSLENGFVH